MVVYYIPICEVAKLRSCEMRSFVVHTESGGGLLACTLLEGCCWVGGEDTHSHCVFIFKRTLQVRKFAN